MYKVNENQHIQPYLEELLPSAHLPDKASLSYNDEIRTRCASNFSQFQISAGFSEKKSQGIRTKYPPTNFQGNSFMGLSTGDIAVAAEPSATSRQMLVTENHHQDVNHLYSRSNFVENYFQGEKKLIPSQYREEHSHDLNLNMSHPLHNDNISIYGRSHLVVFNGCFVGTDNPATSLLANQQSPPPFYYSNESVQEFQPLQMPFHPIYQDDHITNNQQYHQVPLEYHHHHYVTDHSLMNYHPHSQFFHIQSYHEIKNAKKETSENYNYYQQHSERIVEKVKGPSRPKEIRRSSSSSSKYKSEKLSQPPPGLMALQADGIYTPKVIMHKKPIKKPVKANDGRVCVVCSTDNPSSWRRVENSWYCRRYDFNFSYNIIVDVIIITCDEELRFYRKRNFKKIHHC